MYVFNTWLVANLLHPVILAIYFRGEESSINMDALGTYFSLFIYSLVFSVPALIAAALIFMLVKKMPTDVLSAFFAWLFLASSIPFVILFILYLMFFNDGVPFDELGIIIPACIAVFVTVALRINQFMKAFEKRNAAVEINNEQQIN